ncbi:MAG TPA: hypothetical protein VK978_05350 [Candidatus Saccharimonadales bacterium]|nr:hypothetical protein [Candidatus Saccharimonadales bacterium]
MKLKLSLPTLKTHLYLMGRILAVSWRVRRYRVIEYLAGAVLDTAAFILSIYATAQLGSQLAASS